MPGVDLKTENTLLAELWLLSLSLSNDGAEHIRELENAGDLPTKFSKWPLSCLEISRGGMKIPGNKSPEPRLAKVL